MKRASVAEAVKHLNWSMGQKISVDSATMMNKGIWADWSKFLFDMPGPEDWSGHSSGKASGNSMVEYNDGSFLAQLGQSWYVPPLPMLLAWYTPIVSAVGWNV